ncbi:MAG: hypothetical protein ACPL68_05900 [Candidatus Hydrothermia bacterium]
MSINPADTGTYAMDFVTYGGCLLRVLRLSLWTFRWYMATTGGEATIDEMITTGSADWGPLNFVLAWDGANIALYIGGRRVYIKGHGGVFSGPTPYMSVGSRYEGPTIQPFRGDIGHIILHNAVIPPYSGLPEHVYDGELTATEFLRVHNLTEANVLILYDWRNNDGTNYGSGGSDYNLTPQNTPVFLPNEFQYRLVDETTPIIEFPRASILSARLRTMRLKARVKK